MIYCPLEAVQEYRGIRFVLLVTFGFITELDLTRQVRLAQSRYNLQIKNGSKWIVLGLTRFSHQLICP